MGPSTRPEHHLNLNYLPQLSATQPRSGSSTANTSPIEPPAGSSIRSPFGPPGANGMATPIGSARIGAGSPSHEIGGRLYSKRAREIQAQEGLTANMWGPPASGGSTPLRETIPESPSQDGFPDFMPPTENSIQSPRRTRAGTLPSRFSPNGAIGGVPPPLLPKSTRPTPSTSPFKPSSTTAVDNGKFTASPVDSTSALLSRLRAGSMPQRTSYLGPSSPFGPSLFSTNWPNGRERTTTLSSIRSAETPDSPAQSTFSKEGLSDSDVRTLDFLGLETPQQHAATLPPPGILRMSDNQRTAGLQPFMTDLASFNKNLSRFRSYSVNAKEKYAEDEDDEAMYSGQWSGQHSGTLTPSAAAAATALAVTHAQIAQHNAAVQAYANQASVSRPRARTAGVLDSPLRAGRGYFATPSRLDKSMTAAELGMTEGLEYDGLPEAVRAMQLGSGSDENNLEGPTRALWLGSIPTSTTATSLQAIFGIHGKIESARVLVHKNCGFVNYETVESAIQAKSLLNGKEIFPGAGPIRIGYAKAPSASVGGTPGNNGAYPSPSPDPYTKNHVDNDAGATKHGVGGIQHTNGVHAESAAAALQVPELPELRDEMLQIVGEFGASEHEKVQIANSIDASIAFNSFENDIPTVPEPGHARLHDAPKLREIRKRIDNNVISQAEVEETAMGMLPEIAELASDYLGNTVVQKLFEFCSESVKEQMLVQISPHIAEIGVHKNGTWAAQKIIDVAKTPNQIAMIVNNLRPYTVALFLDQYGNYVLQCCLKFGYPWNNFIFESMLSRIWDIAQGRFGARAMRACLESHNSTKDQQRMLAAAIALHSVQLATNANGALLLTWFLDTCTFPRRRTVLAPRLVPHLVHLCTHKVAYLTVLKVINQRNEPEARDTVLQALFFSPNDQTLEDILSDQACGATLIFKILTTPFFDENMRSDVVQNVRGVLCRLKASPSQGYKRLMDEVGLSSARLGKADRDSQSPSGRGPHHDRSRPMSQHGTPNGHMHQPKMVRQYSGPNLQTMGRQQFASPGLMPLDTNNIPAFEQYGLGGLNSPNFTPNPLNQQLQYQALLAQAQARGISPGISPGGFYSGMSAPGLGGYATPSPSIDNFRNLQAQNPPMPQMSPNPMGQQAGFPPPSFNPLMGAGMMPGYQYPMSYFPQQQQQQQQQQQMQQQQNRGRRGRR
ncbi:hypothetical protein MMC08_009132 [Hypocenomyce scalaris]|nr:hypothetical protein [Hypocenomyce scalaris]